MKVGRSAIDEDAIRLLEQNNPDIQFDWSRILKAPVPVSAPPVHKEERRGRDRRPDRPPRSGGPAPHAAPPPDAPPPDPEEPAELAAEQAQLAADPEALTSDPTFEPTEDLDSEGMGEAGPDAEIEAVDPDPPVLPGGPEPAESAASSRLGPEVLARLRARYAEIMARIGERPLEEDAREELRQRAERLNPDSWVTADEVAQALEVYENVYDGLRAVVGHPHRRRRRGRKGRGDGPGGQV